MSSFSPPRTKRRPRLTFVSDGKPLRRFELTSKAGQVVGALLACHDTLLWRGSRPLGDRAVGGKLVVIALAEAVPRVGRKHRS